jgi:hypothetical protein
MFFRKKKPKRLYIPTKSKWYNRPRRRRTSLRGSKKVFSHNIKTHFSRLFKDAFAFTVATFILIGIVIFILFSGQFSLDRIEVVRDDLTVDTARIQTELNQYLGKNLLFFNRQVIADHIRDNYPEFETVRVRKLLPDRIKVELSTHEIVANIRAYYELPEVEADPLENLDGNLTDLDAALEDVFTLEEESTAEDESNIIEQKALLNRVGQAIFDREENLELMTLYVEGLTQPIEDREFVIPTRKMNTIMDIIKYYRNTLQMDVAGLKYLPVAREVHLISEKDMVIWISLEKDYRDQIDKMNTVYKVAELNKEDIRYIDLRVSEKLIYCPKNTACSR